MSLTKTSFSMIDGAEFNVLDYGADNTGTNDSTNAIEAASAAAAIAKGKVYFPSGTYKYTRLTIYPYVVFQGESQSSTYLICTDYTSTDSGLTIGSSFRANDDNIRVTYAGFRDLSIYAGATSGVSAQQDIFQNVIGLNLCMCEHTVIENVTFGGWGQGAMVFARAEGGAEGLGFVNSTQDGNYNQVTNVTMASCGKYNTDTAAIWLKYKANSNKFYGTYAKGMTGSGVVAIPHGNDNLFAGGTAESCAYIFKIGGGTGASGNTVVQFRAENLTGNAYEFLASGTVNYVFGGYHTGVSGSVFVDAGGTNRIISGNYNKLKTVNFPPVTNYSTTNQIGVLQITAMNGDTDYPFYVKSETYNDPTKYPYQLFWSDVIGGAAGNILGRLGWYNSDTTAGAAGVSATVDAVLEGSGGQTGVVISTGTGTTLTENFRIRSNGAVVQTLPTAVTTLTENNKMTMTLTSDTNLRISVRGSDGVTRVANLTLA